MIALQPSEQMASKRPTFSEENRQKTMQRGNIKRPKKLLSDRFGSIANIESNLKTRQRDSCCASVHPLNQELIDFETGKLKRTYDNLRVNVKLELKDQDIAVPELSYNQTTCSPSLGSTCGNDFDGSASYIKGSMKTKPYEQSDLNIQNAESHDRYATEGNACTKGNLKVSGKEHIVIHAQKGSLVDIQHQPVLSSETDKGTDKTSEALKRPFFYAEQNCVPPKKRYGIQKESKKLGHSVSENKSKNDVVKGPPGCAQNYMQQGESRRMSSCPEQSGSDGVMLFEGRTLLKGGVKPRHIPKTVVEKDVRGPPTDPRVLKPDYGLRNGIKEYKVLLWHKDWLFDYTRKLVEARKSQWAREHERFNACKNKEKNSEDGFSVKKQYQNTKTVEKRNNELLSSVSEKQMEDENIKTLKSAVSDLVENIRNSGSSTKQCFEYDHSHKQTAVVQKTRDPRSNNEGQQLCNITERVYHNSSEAEQVNGHKAVYKYYASKGCRKKSEEIRVVPKYDAKLKYLDKNSPDGVSCFGKTGAVLRDPSKRNLSKYISGDKELNMLSTSAMHSTYYNKNLSPIYQERQNDNSHKKRFPVAYKGKDRHLDKFPQFSQHNWY